MVEPQVFKFGFLSCSVTSCRSRKVLAIGRAKAVKGPVYGVSESHKLRLWPLLVGSVIPPQVGKKVKNSGAQEQQNTNTGEIQLDLLI